MEIVGIVANPGGPGMEQMTWNLVDAGDGFLVGKRYVWGLRWRELEQAA